MSLETVLIRITGRDEPGITTAIMSILAGAGADVQDVEQIVIRGRLNLGVLVDVPRGKDVFKEILLLGWERKLDVDFELVEGVSTTAAIPTLVVSVIGAALSPADLELVTAAIAKSGGNIERIRRLAKSPVWCYEFEVHGGDADQMRVELIDTAAETPRFDVAIQRAGLGRRAQRLVVLDVDSTLVQNEMIDLLADQVGQGEACAAITRAAMAGELDFESSLRERVRLLAGQPEEVIAAAYDELILTEGAETFIRTLKTLGYRVAIVSGGFTSFTDRLRDLLDIDYAYANTLEIRRGILTGELLGPIVDRGAKGSLLVELAEKEGISLEQVVAVGDGANDLDMLTAAGLGVAFCAKSVVREVADTTVSTPHLEAVLFLLGVRGEEIHASTR